MNDSNWRIALSDVSIGDRERQAVDDVLRGGWLSMGPVTSEFEAAFAEKVGSPTAVAVSSGTAALHVAAAALGIGPGDEVICPTLTFVGTAAAMRHAGATVRLADSTSVDDFSIDPEEIERLAGPNTKAVVVVHYGGHPVDFTAVREAAAELNLHVIEDAAHALGSTLEGVYCGTLGEAGCFSFFPNKNMTTGEGGMVVFRNDEAAERARKLRSHAMTTLTWQRHKGHASSYDVVDLGFNYRLDEMRAALGLVQLSRLDGFNDARQTLAARYRSQLADVDGITIPSFGGRGHSAHHLMVVLADSGSARDHLRERLTRHRIQTSLHYPPIHRFTHYRVERASLPRAEEIADRVVTLPLHPGLTHDDVDVVCATIAARD